MKHLLKLEDWSTDEIINTLNLADQLKYEQKHGIEHKILAGKTLGMIFEKSSTRTRVSFEVGMNMRFLKNFELDVTYYNAIQ
jgi:ornithine carbamoyltransferase